MKIPLKIRYGCFRIIFKGVNSKCIPPNDEGTSGGSDVVTSFSLMHFVAVALIPQREGKDYIATWQQTCQRLLPEVL